MAYVLSFKAKTWYKDSHSLFDYESNKISEFNLDVTLPEKHIGIFRKKNCTSIINQATSVTITNKPEAVDRQLYDLLSYMKIRQSQNINSCRLEFSDSKQIKRKNKKTQRQNTDQSNSSTDFKEEAYIVVSRLRDLQGNQTGFKLNVGQVVKLGRVQYFVSEISFNGDKKLGQSKNKLTICNRNIIKFSPDFHRKQINSCKICLDQTETKQNFLFNPCKCTGSCGTVHIQCLQHWIQIKVKKQTIGGTTHFNYQKFECQICKTELPMIIDTNETQIELLPIQKPKGNYMILEAACQKTKSVMLIRNPGPQGIKLGRGHECQIRITDISVSRNHARIKMNQDGFYIYDNKSKFGTLVRDQNVFDLEVGGMDRGIQMGRTFVEVQVKKKV